MDRAQRRRPTIAKGWQLAVLKKLQAESGNPTEEQRSAVAAETGLDEKWVKDWFTRQRSKVAARNRKGQLSTVPTFKLQLCYPPEVPSGPPGVPSHRSVSTPIDPTPHLPTNSHRPPSPAGLGSRSPRPSRSAVNTPEMSPSYPSIAIPMHPNLPPQKPAHITTIPTYSRDPLCNRYPDFSQFFHPQVYERFCSSELSASINDHDHFIQPLANSSMDSHTFMHLHGLFNVENRFHPDGLSTHQDSPTYLQSCPVAFSMRLVDLLSHP